MKHVFVVYSHLTFYISRQIIITENLSTKDCFFILVSNYKMIPKFEKEYPNYIQLSYGGYVKEGRFFAGFNFVKTNKNIKRFDAMIEQYTDSEEYICYIGHCRSDVENLLVSNSKCKGYHIIEEGVGSYNIRNFKTFHGLKSVIHKLFLKPLFPRLYGIKEYNLFVKSSKFLGFYSTSPRCFPEFKFEKKIIDNPFEFIEMNPSPDAIISIDPLFLWVDIPVVKDIYNHLSNYIATKKYNYIAYKFHQMFERRPEMKVQYKELIRYFFGDNLIELDNSVVLENILKSYRCDFYSMRSSAGIYGTQSGAKCYAYTSLLRNYITIDDNHPLKDIFIEISFNSDAQKNE